MILYLENTKETTRKLLELINEFAKVSGYKINPQKLTAFLYTNNARSEREIRETIPIIITWKRVKYLGINLLKDLYSENYKTLMKESSVKSAIQWNTNIRCFHWHVESEKRTDWTSLQNRCWLTDIEKLMVSGGDSFGGGGMCLGCGIEILSNWIVMIIIQKNKIK